MSGRWLAALLLGAMVVAMTFAVFDDNGLMRLYELRRKRDEIRRENRRIEEMNTDLKRKVKLLRNDIRYVERIAREELGLIVFRFSTAPDHAASEEPEHK